MMLLLIMMLFVLLFVLLFVRGGTVTQWVAMSSNTPRMFLVQVLAEEVECHRKVILGTSKNFSVNF